MRVNNCLSWVVFSGKATIFVDINFVLYVEKKSFTLCRFNFLLDSLAGDDYVVAARALVAE